jgi:hypothetical protein
MKAKKVYDNEQWERVSALPVEFFRQYASLVTKKNRTVSSTHLDIILNQGQTVEDPFSEEDLYELFRGNFDGLILAYIMKNQNLFIKTDMKMR